MLWELKEILKNVWRELKFWVNFNDNKNFGENFDYLKNFCGLRKIIP